MRRERDREEPDKPGPAPLPAYEGGINLAALLFLFNLVSRLNHLPALLVLAKAVEALLHGQEAGGVVSYHGVKLEIDADLAHGSVCVKKVA